MKLERISENRIRCTLTTSDLADRRLKLSELAYGSDKAKGLFHELIDQASDELGFDADGRALVVEAIPLSSESIILLITAVDEPEEFDTRFSRFTDFDSEPREDDAAYPTPDAETALRGTLAYEFSHLDDISDMCAVIPDSVPAQCETALYKDPLSGSFFLLVRNTGTEDSYSTVCSAASEYGKLRRVTDASLCYIREHYICMIKENAIEIMRSI